MKEVILPSGTHAKIWQKIKLGTFKNVSDLEAEAARRFLLCYSPKEGIKKSAFTIANQEEWIILTKFTVADLQMGDCRRYSDICSKAKELGLNMCSIEVPLQLCIQGPFYPNHTYVNIAIDPLQCSSPNSLEIFLLGGYHNRSCLDARTVVDLLGGNPFPFQDHEEIVFRIME